EFVAIGHAESVREDALGGREFRYGEHAQVKAHGQGSVGSAAGDRATALRISEWSQAPKRPSTWALGQPHSRVVTATTPSLMEVEARAYTGTREPENQWTTEPMNQ